MNDLKLEVGMYVKHKCNLFGISKIKETGFREVDTYEGIVKCYDGHNYFVREITKASHNIIDLIEVGDVLRVKQKFNNNGIKIVEVTGTSKYADGRTSVVVDGNFLKIRLEDYELLSILTKEQYEANCYKVEVE